MRAFIALDFPQEVVNEIVKIQKELPFFKGKITEKENLHLTLKFLGEISEEKVKKIEESLERINLSSFEAELEHIGVFSEDFVKIVWVSIKGCDKLQEQIDKSLSNLFSKEKRFMSHLTIARVKNIENKKIFLNKLKEINFSRKKFLVKEFKLIQSNLTKKGPVYDVLKSYSLKKENIS